MEKETRKKELGQEITDEPLTDESFRRISQEFFKKVGWTKRGNKTGAVVIVPAPRRFSSAMPQETINYSIEPDLNCPRNERDFEISQTILFKRYASAIFSKYEKWKDIPQYYFIKLRMNLGYYTTDGLSMLLANPPYWLGTIVRNSIEHPELFGGLCPHNHTAYAFNYGGSPLSGRFSLHLICPECGWTGDVERRGWKVRSDALRKTQGEDGKLLEQIPSLKVAPILELLRYIGIPESELILPQPEESIFRSVFPDGEVTLFDNYGGAAIITRKTVHFRGWEGPSKLIDEEVKRIREADALEQKLPF